MKKTKHRFIYPLPMTVVALSVAGSLVACDGGGGGSGVSSGASTLRGTVVKVGDSSDRAGVRVTVGGADRATTTSDDGFFVVSGVSPGDRNVNFKRGDVAGSLGLDVPRKAEIDLGNVTVNPGNASPSRISITRFRDDDASSDGDDSSADGASAEDDNGGDSGTSGGGGSSGSGSGSGGEEEDSNSGSGSGNSGPGGGS